MLSVFFDESGDVDDENQPVVVLAAVVADDQQVQAISQELDNLRAKLPDSIRHTQRFEFHAERIFHGKSPWDRLTLGERRALLNSLHKVIGDSLLPWAMILADKAGGVGGGLESLSSNVGQWSSMAEEIAKKENPEELEMLQKYASKIPPANFGDRGNMTALLLGLTTTLLHLEGFDGRAKLIPDKRFFHAVSAWQEILAVMRTGWPAPDQLSRIPGFPRDLKPGWHLDSAIAPVESYDCYGVQLADVLGYVTRRAWLSRQATTRFLANSDLGRLRPHYTYSGIWPGISGPVSNTKIPARRFAPRPFRGFQAPRRYRR